MAKIKLKNLSFKLDPDRVIVDIQIPNSAEFHTLEMSEGEARHLADFLQRQANSFPQSVQSIYPPMVVSAAPTLVNEAD